MALTILPCGPANIRSPAAVEGHLGAAEDGAVEIEYGATVLPFTIWTLRGFVNGVPIELEEAAMIGGCTRTGAFWRVTFPLLAPGLVATGVFGFSQAWNEFLLALVGGAVKG